MMHARVRAATRPFRVTNWGKPMRIGCLICAAIAGIAMGGCATDPRPFDGHGLSTKDCASGHKCKVTITPLEDNCKWSHACTADVDPEEVVLLRGEQNIDIVWTLPAGFSFCRGLQDGIALKTSDSNNQFEDMYPTDNPNGDKPAEGADCKNFRHYHWKAKNSTPSLYYPYAITFHDRTGVHKYTVDPWIINR
jgi:hypothetical protein